MSKRKTPTIPVVEEPAERPADEQELAETGDVVDASFTVTPEEHAPVPAEPTTPAAPTPAPSFIPCPKCAAPLVNVVSGAVCSNGCGSGILPHLSAESNRKAMAVLAISSLPICQPIARILKQEHAERRADTKLYFVVGRPGIFLHVPRKSKKRRKASGNLLAVYRAKSRIVELALHPEMMSCFGFFLPDAGEKKAQQSIIPSEGATP